MEPNCFKAERMMHPRSSLIPDYLLGRMIIDRSRGLLLVMQAEEGDLMSLLEASPPDFVKLPDTWLVIALTHPELSLELLRQISRILAIRDEDLFNAAIIGNKIDFFEALVIEHAKTKTLDTLIAAQDYRAFRVAAQNGHLHILVRLMTLAPDKVQTMIAASDYDAFRKAAADGHLHILDRLMVLAPDKVQTMIAASNYDGFQSAARNGHLHILERLMTLAPDKIMIDASDYRAFREAAQNGHLHIVERLMALAPDKVQDMIAAYAYEAFREAARNGHLHIIERLMALAPDKVQTMIANCGYSTIRESFFRHHACLLRIPFALAYAEMHEMEYGERYVHPFIDDKLTTLRAKKTRVEEDNPHAVFDIADTTEAELCFYMLRNLIRRNDSALRDNIIFLLGIPAVKALAHTEVTRGEPNELLCLALSYNNRMAAGLLDAIPAVHDLAVRNHYYHVEARGIFNLRALAQDRESSMRGLTTGEEKRLKAALLRYEPRIRLDGVPHIMTTLRQTLESRYAANPAKITRDDGSEQALPMNFEDVQKLALSPTETENALKAYYQHKDHTAFRYLLKPNPWMHEDASYVEANHHEKWSTFEEYQPLISMLYLAAIDEEIPPTDGYTLETRLEHFIDELAHIGRAHNWDHIRVVLDSEGAPLLHADGNPITEESDDLEGDRPSCFSGVKRRLFQSVLGHPLLKLVTQADIVEELRDFVRAHFKAVIAVSNQALLKKAWDSYIEAEAPNDDDMTTLKVLDISFEQQTLFFDAIATKYGSQFTDEPAFVKQVQDAFKLNDKEAHAFNFGYVGLDQLLEEPVRVASPSAIGFFATASKEDLEPHSENSPFFGGNL